MYFQVRIHIKLSMVAFFLFGGGCATRFCYATLYCEQNGTKQHQFFEWIHKLLFHVKQCQKYLDMRRTQAEVLQTEQLVTKSDQPMMMLGGDGYKNTGWFGKGSLERYSASRVCFVLTNTVWTTINKLYLLICWWLSVNNKHSFIHEKLPGKTIHSHLLAPRTLGIQVGGKTSAPIVLHGKWDLKLWQPQLQNYEPSGGDPTFQNVSSALPM